MRDSDVSRRVSVKSRDKAHWLRLYLHWRDASPAVLSLLPYHPVAIGRAPTCDIVLDGPTVSRRHCRITPGIAISWIEDLGSTLGTEAGGHRGPAQILRNRDVIEVGAVALVFLAHAGAEIPHA